MKIIADDGTEHTPKTREEGYALVQKLLADSRFGRRPGHHVEKLQSGYFRYKYVEKGEANFGPSRHTFDEAAADYQLLIAGQPLPPVAAGKGSEEHRKKCSESHRRWYEAAKAAAPDGKIHLKPATCSGCGEVGHKKNFCPKAGWAAKAKPVKTPRPHAPVRLAARGCVFCGGAGHGATQCPQRRQALAERLSRRAA